MKTNLVPKGFGQVIGIVEYEIGITVNLQAHSNIGFVFIVWEENEKVTLKANPKRNIILKVG